MTVTKPCLDGGTICVSARHYERVTRAAGVRARRDPGKPKSNKPHLIEQVAAIRLLRGIGIKSMAKWAQSTHRFRNRCSATRRRNGLRIRQIGWSTSLPKRPPIGIAAGKASARGEPFQVRIMHLAQAETADHLGWRRTQRVWCAAVDSPSCHGRPAVDITGPEKCPNSNFSGAHDGGPWGRLAGGVRTRFQLIVLNHHQRGTSEGMAIAELPGTGRSCTGISGAFEKRLLPIGAVTDGFGQLLGLRAARRLFLRPKNSSIFKTATWRESSDSFLRRLITKNIDMKTFVSKRQVEDQG